MKELSSSCTHRPFYEQKMRLTSFFTHIGCVWPKIWYQISLAMINASCCSKNLGPFLPKDPIWGYKEKACPSGASIGWQVYPQNKHNFGFLVQTTIYKCCNAVQGMQQGPYSPQKIPWIHPMRVLYEVTIHGLGITPNLPHLTCTEMIYSTRGHLHSLNCD